MACIITYENKKYTQKEFEQYFKEHFTEFVDNFLGSKKDIEGFKKFVEKSNDYNNIEVKEDESIINSETYQKAIKLVEINEVNYRMEETPKETSKNLASKKVKEEKEKQKVKQDKELKKIDSKIEGKLKEWLKLVGIDYISSNVILDKDGVPMSAIAKADLLAGIIEVVEDRRDITTLPEEAAHVFVMLLGEDNELYRQMKYAIIDTDFYNDVKNEYKDVKGYTEEKILKEAIGKAIGYALLNQELDINPPSKGIINAIMKFINTLFNKIANSKLSSAIVKAELDPFRTAAEKILNMDIGGLKKLDELEGTYDDLVFYELSQQTLDNVKQVLAELNTKRVEAMSSGYVTIAGVKVSTRVTDHVKRYYRQLFKRQDLDDVESVLSRNVGHVIHAIARKAMNNLISTGYAGNISISSIKSELLNARDSEGNLIYPDLQNVKNDFWNINVHQIIPEIERIYNEIKEDEKRIQTLTGTKEESKIFTELTIYNKEIDEAGTLDLLVVHPNGVAAIYDYKSMAVKFGDKNILEFGIPDYKRRSFDIQMLRYAKALKESYGIEHIGKMRIVPFAVKFDYGRVEQISSYSTVHDLKIKNNLTELVSGNEELLRYTKTGVEKDSQLNIRLNELYALRDSLRIQVRNSFKNKVKYELLKSQLDTTSKLIDSILTNKEIKELDRIVLALKDSFDKRSVLSEESIDYLTRDDLIDLQSAIKALKTYIEIYVANNEVPKNYKELLGLSLMDLNILDNQVLTKIVNYIDTQIPIGGTITQPMKKLGFLSRYFANLSNIDIPAFKKLSYIITNIYNNYNISISKFEKDFDKVYKPLVELSKSTGISVQEYYDMLINLDRMTLKTKYTKEFYEEKNEILTEGRKAIEKKDVAGFTKAAQWVLKHSNVQFTNNSFEFKDPETKKYLLEARKKKKEELEIKYGKGSDTAKIEYKKWAYKYDIYYNEEDSDAKNMFVRFSALLNSSNHFIKIQSEEDRHISKDYTAIRNIPQLSNFYDFLIKSNNNFARITGTEIKGNFIAHIRNDMIDAIGQNGFSSLWEDKNSLFRSLEVQQNDVIQGVIDPDTGKPVANIPLLYTDPIFENLTDSEIKIVEEEVSKQFQKGTIEYERALDKAMDEYSFKKGNKHSSRDLGKNLLLFARSAYLNSHLREQESVVKNMLYYLKNKGTEAPVDNLGNPIVDKFSSKLMQVAGIPQDNLNAFESFINMYFYGQNLQTGFNNFRTGRKYDKEGNLIQEGKIYSFNKMIQAAMQYVAIKNMALNPFVGFGNAISTSTGMLFAATDGKFISRESLNKGIKTRTNNEEKVYAAIDIFRPYAHDATIDKSLKVSSSFVSRHLTNNMLFSMMRKPDMLADEVVLLSGLHEYGIKDNKIIRLSKDSGAVPLIDALSKDANGDWYIKGLEVLSTEGITDVKKILEIETHNKFVLSEMTRFRTMVQRTSTAIKGTIPEADKSLFGTSLAGQVLMQFRRWIPGLAQNRFNALNYDEVFQDFDEGRLTVLFAEIFQSGGVLNGSKEILTTVITSALPFMKVGGLKKMSDNVARIQYQKFVTNNPNLVGKLSFEDYMALRERKMNAVVLELRTLIYFAALVMLAASMFKKGDDDDDDTVVENFLQRNFYLLSTRGFLEVAFFFNPTSISTFLKRPVPLMDLWDSADNIITNFGDEFRDMLNGENSPNDHTPFGYYTLTDFLVFGRWLNQMFDPQENVKPN